MVEERCETCPFHREEVLERKNQKDDIEELKECTAALKRTVTELVTTTALISNDMNYIKKPLSVVAVAVILYVAGAFFKILPYISKMGDVTP